MSVGEWPILIANKIRVRLEYSRLDVRLKHKIVMRHHYRGTYLKPRHPEDSEAIAWIKKQSARWGVLVWARTGLGGSARFDWVVKKQADKQEAR